MIIIKRAPRNSNRRTKYARKPDESIFMVIFSVIITDDLKGVKRRVRMNI